MRALEALVAAFDIALIVSAAAVAVSILAL